MTSEEAQRELNRRIQANEYIKPKELDGKDLIEVLELEQFKKNVSRLMREQRELRKIVADTGININRHTIDSILELGLLSNEEDFILEYAKCKDKCSALPTAQRDYILELGDKALNSAIFHAIIEANEDLKELYNIIFKVN